MKDLSPRTARTTEHLFQLGARGIGDFKSGIAVSENYVYLYLTEQPTVVISRDDFEFFVDWYNGNK